MIHDYNPVRHIVYELYSFIYFHKECSKTCMNSVRVNRYKWKKTVIFKTLALRLVGLDAFQRKKSEAHSFFYAGQAKYLMVSSLSAFASILLYSPACLCHYTHCRCSTSPRPNPMLWGFPVWVVQTLGNNSLNAHVFSTSNCMNTSKTGK